MFVLVTNPPLLFHRHFNMLHLAIPTYKAPHYLIGGMLLRRDLVIIRHSKHMIHRGSVFQSSFGWPGPMVSSPLRPPYNPANQHRLWTFHLQEHRRTQHEFKLGLGVTQNEFKLGLELIPTLLAGGDFCRKDVFWWKAIMQVDGIRIWQ